YLVGPGAPDAARETRHFPAVDAEYLYVHLLGACQGEPDPHRTRGWVRPWHPQPHSDTRHRLDGRHAQLHLAPDPGGVLRRDGHVLLIRALRVDDVERRVRHRI